jgi:hypothetical protein
VGIARDSSGGGCFLMEVMVVGLRAEVREDEFGVLVCLTRCCCCCYRATSGIAARRRGTGFWKHEAKVYYTLKAIAPMQRL